MTTRKIAAETNGPITIDATLLGHGGSVSVRADASCERATLTVSTVDEDGPAAEAVRNATLRQTLKGLHVNVQGDGGTTGGTTIISGGGRGMTIVQTAGNVTGTMIGYQGGVIGGDMIVNGVRVSGGATVIQGSSPIEIVAVVPEGSSAIGHTQSASIDALGALLNVTADTQSGSVRTGHVAKVNANTQSGSVVVEQAADITAKTMSGSIRLGRTDVVNANTMSGSVQIADFGGTARIKTMSGSVRVHATAGGDIDANTMSGSITVTATDTALAEDLDVRPHSMSGRISVPSRRTGSSGPRRR
ncbi:DUF4097 domain-containing protein [Streptomyces platensis]|uniref:DUF4097 family beta strand repeat-containing protein n=1 Tax=Streptomyces platensis TaxID=58346 RepID=UPI002E123BFD|nr:DUF4097 domain-containing protein [Streptomyces platensis]